MHSNAGNGFILFSPWLPRAGLAVPRSWADIGERCRDDSNVVPLSVVADWLCKPPARKRLLEVTT